MSTSPVMRHVQCANISKGRGQDVGRTWAGRGQDVMTPRVSKCLKDNPQFTGVQIRPRVVY
jgi:hypothetical protein